MKYSSNSKLPILVINNDWILDVQLGIYSLVTNRWLAIIEEAISANIVSVHCREEGCIGKYLPDSALAFLEVLSALFILRGIPAIFVYIKKLFAKRVNNVLNVH